jgi:hypothetical protein
MNLDGLSLIGFAHQALAGSVSERFQGGEGAHQRLVGLDQPQIIRRGAMAQVCPEGSAGGAPDPAPAHPLSGLST